MGWVQDLLREVPLSSVLKERVALADEKYEGAMKEIEALSGRVIALEKENAELRAQLPQGQKLGDDTVRVLVHLFRTDDLDGRDVGAMSRALGMERGVLKYHLDRLDDVKLAECPGGNYVEGHFYWALTSDGRRHVIEHKLI